MTLSSSSLLEACTYLHFFMTSPASFVTSVEGLRFFRSLIRFLSRFYSCDAGGKKQKQEKANKKTFGWCLCRLRRIIGCYVVRTVNYPTGMGCTFWAIFCSLAS